MSMSATKRPRPQRQGANLPDTGLLLELFEQMVLLRRFELAARAACRGGETPGFLHLYIGEEATAVGVCAHLTPRDWVTSTHRGHGHALAKGSNPGAVMAELFGKAGGICGGRGGTMHLYDRTVGLFGTNGVVGAGIGHAARAGARVGIARVDHDRPNLAPGCSLVLTTHVYRRRAKAVAGVDAGQHAAGCEAHNQHVATTRLADTGTGGAEFDTGNRGQRGRIGCSQIDGHGLAIQEHARPEPGAQTMNRCPRRSGPIRRGACP